MDYCNNGTSRSRSGISSFGFGSFFRWIRNHLRSQRSPISPRSLLLVVFGLVLAGALACQVIWQHSRATRLRIEIASLEERNHQLRMKIHRAELEVARLERLDRIQQIAVTELGMRERDKARILEMSRAQWASRPEGGTSP